MDETAASLWTSHPPMLCHPEEEAESQKLQQLFQTERQEAAVLEQAALEKVKRFYVKHFGFFSSS